MNIETAKAAVDFLVANAETDELKIAFLGGEPLMNMPVITETVNYCHEIEKIQLRNSHIPLPLTQYC